MLQQASEGQKCRCRTAWWRAAGLTVELWLGIGEMLKGRPLFQGQLVCLLTLGAERDTLTKEQMSFSLHTPNIVLQSQQWALWIDFCDGRQLGGHTECRVSFTDFQGAIRIIAWIHWYSPAWGPGSFSVAKPYFLEITVGWKWAKVESVVCFRIWWCIQRYLNQRRWYFSF